ncbi:MarR family winged helix-turn-helix transcriptional regulator [Nesterenkonia lutea]|uniref:DNA-binding MarR family transcriptional regulator n=1 Tax=Nesterenkonia lutea TaxID=272919 RepID=A0ABR9JHF7_9MICC|nr:MarR family transcriptional regulator [Nesterenkonia lutea]MBE1525361.1 DNA-binding MarR family transcriptional regulator [Nesterenkonia lutea]
MTTRWLTSYELAAWVRLASILEMLPGALDGQLRRDAELTHFDYRVLSFLSESENQTLRMTYLAQVTNATLPRLSHVVSRLEKRGYLRRSPCEEDRRATNAVLTESGWEKVVAAAPGHVEAVRSLVLDGLSPEQVTQLTDITSRILDRLDAGDTLRPLYAAHDADVTAEQARRHPSVSADSASLD